MKTSYLMLVIVLCCTACAPKLPSVVDVKSELQTIADIDTAIKTALNGYYADVSRVVGANYSLGHVESTGDFAIVYKYLYDTDYTTYENCLDIVKNACQGDSYHLLSFVLNGAGTIKGYLLDSKDVIIDVKQWE